MQIVGWADARKPNIPNLRFRSGKQVGCAVRTMKLR